ncbi:hypothetical protein O6H91_02G076400 [Diphasiastrum complanatum]|uniref:Uncharacterized protein n=1 Tax=Diphasiastrum complanatum TaxID=34168 RepID=A0ACC2EHL0_DIPCM|nr:hypothetical protein O6H91_02G076400 [Diphasiastrum complanatum]
MMNMRFVHRLRKTWRSNVQKSLKTSRVTATARSKLHGKPRKTSVGPIQSVSTNPFSFKILKELASKFFGHNTVQDRESVQINATIILEKKSFLKLLDIGADLVDDVDDVLAGRRVTLQLISAEVDPETDTGKVSNKVVLNDWYGSRDEIEQSDIKYKLQFEVDREFGLPGAFLVQNQHHNEFYLKTLILEMPDQSIIQFPCNSWIYNMYKYSGDRVFFSNKVYLPDDTPVGLWKLREQELMMLRGDGKGERQEWDRIYDYDTYNDLGNPDHDKSLLRPVLGKSEEFPYPRRCRTGRAPCVTDPLSESPVSGLADIYIPRDERFSATKSMGFLADTVKAAAHNLLPALESLFEQPASTDFGSFRELKELYDEIRDFVKQKGKNKSTTAAEQKLFDLRTQDEAGQDILEFPIPQVICEDENAWMRDEEFARQMLAGLNPMVIERLEVFPPKSKLNPGIYGTHTSALTASHIKGQLEGLTVEQALENKKLFTVDYYDIYIPSLNKINSEHKGPKSYASRTIFFYTKENILKPVAIELCLPPPPNTIEPGYKRVFVPPLSGNTKDWLWELAKAHVRTNHVNYHQLISHWLETHATVEPFIIATHRQLSAIHPLNPFLLPHFKNTMSINSQARKALISANGIIEKCFLPRNHSIETSAAIYKEYWHFDELSLPKDLLKRKMALPDATSKYQLKLIIEDYPYAHDGLEIWNTLREWVHDYIHIYYKDDATIKLDSELQTWWNEIRTVGHGDKKHDIGWIKLETRENLEDILTTIIWISSAHHAAVNFGQYAYAGYMPNSPTCAQRFIPDYDSVEHFQIVENPEKYFLSTLSTKVQATTVMTTVEILSTHSTEEEYLGERAIKCWTDNQEVIAAFDKFSSKVKDIEKLITNRNENPELKHRRGPANVPYTLLHPSSPPGVTGKGVPNSISI